MFLLCDILMSVLYITISIDHICDVVCTQDSWYLNNHYNSHFIMIFNFNVFIQ